MAKKVIMGVLASILLGAIALFAAEKAAQEKKAAETPKQQERACDQPALSKVEGPKGGEELLDQLIAAYKANDREKMGEIIKKMEQRREKMRDFAQADGGHRWAHHRMRPEGCGWQMPCGGQPCQRPCCWGGGMGACGQSFSERPQMRCCGMPCCGQWRQGPPCGAMGGWGPPACGNRPMCGRGAGTAQDCGQGDRPACDMPKGDKATVDDPSPESDW
jgi:hypothetical protein